MISRGGGGSGGDDDDDDGGGGNDTGNSTEVPDSGNSTEVPTIIDGEGDDDKICPNEVMPCVDDKLFVAGIPVCLYGGINTCLPDDEDLAGMIESGDAECGMCEFSYDLIPTAEPTLTPAPSITSPPMSDSTLFPTDDGTSSPTTTTPPTVAEIPSDATVFPSSDSTTTTTTADDDDAVGPEEEICDETCSEVDGISLYIICVEDPGGDNCGITTCVPEDLFSGYTCGSCSEEFECGAVDEETDAPTTISPSKMSPSNKPSKKPTPSPDNKPTKRPTPPPTNNSDDDDDVPTNVPIDEPTNEPVDAPTEEPVVDEPTDEPVEETTMEPVESPVERPTDDETKAPRKLADTDNDGDKKQMIII